MLSQRKYLKKYWKPPFYGISLSLLMLFGQLGLTQEQDDRDRNNHTNSDAFLGLPEDVPIATESTAYSIRFYLKDEGYEIVNVTCKSIKNVDHLCNPEHVCESLEPCSQYLSTVTIKKLGEEQPTVIEKAIDVSTVYAEPEIIMDDPVPGQEEINITWSASNQACIKTFEIEAKSEDKLYKYSLANDASVQQIKGLDPCQDYQIQLQTEDVNQKVVSNLTTTASTLYAEPDNVVVTIEPHDEAQVKVMWKPPKFKTCVSYYTLKWKRKECMEPIGLAAEFIENTFPSGEDMATTAPMIPATPGLEGENSCVSSTNLTDASAKEYVIGNLQGCEEYEFEIFINNNLTAKCEPQIFISPEQAPGVVTSSTLVLSATTVTINWDPPQAHRKCVNFYRISVTGPAQRATEFQKTNNKNTEKIMTFFDSLEPCGHYNYTVTAVSSSGTTGVSMNATFDTMEAKPSPIRNDRVEEEAFNITVSWDPPNFADLCLNGYRLTAWRDENSPAFDKITNDTTVVIDNLYSCQWYVVQIIPTTQNMDGELKQIEAETKPIVSQAPNNFQAIGLYPDSFELSATEAGLNNKCETIVARFTCELSKPTNVMYKRAEQYVEGEVGGITFKALLSPLSPYTDYKCNVALYNIAGWSANRTILATTEPYFPDPPQNLMKRRSTNSSINFVWWAPRYANGNIKLYISRFQLVESAYFIPPDCNNIASTPITRETSSLEQDFVNLKPFTKYSIQVAAQNEYGVGEYTMPYIVKTAPWVSEPIVDLRVVAQGPFTSDTSTEFKANVVLSWTLPCKSNGQIESFLLEFTGEREGHEQEQFQRIVKPEFDERGRMTYNETDLKPEYNYTVSVAVKTVDVVQLGPRVTGLFDAPAGIPERMDDTVVAQTKVDAYAASNPTNSAVVRFPTAILNSESGTILYVALLLSEKNCNQDASLHYGALNANLEWPDSMSWNEVNDANTSNCIQEYQTTPLRWKPNPSRLSNYRDDLISKYAQAKEYIEYTIGTEKCDRSTKRYCNGPLRPDTRYNLIIRLFTKSGFNDATMLEFRTDSLIELTKILIGVISCLLIAFIAGFIYLWITKRIVWQRQSCHGIEDCFGDVISKNFAIFYSDVSKPEKIQREFKELTVVAMDLSYSASEIGYNKNRYADIFPYDKNRVILDIDAEGSDYINASFIDGYRRRKEYIATQGPKPESVLDFWRMILQHNVRVIVMVTQFREGDVIKCHEYFPYKSKTINATIKKRDSFEIYDRTEMSVTHDKYGLKQKVVHFYFKKWPDHGCPTDPMQLITFVRKVKAEKVPSYSPIVVHCSAGVGRTGTFIGLDIIMQRLRSESKINIYETVKKLRFQRMKMVQTLAQYSFLYACTYELVKHKKTRTALKYQKETGKKVSFQDDPEVTNSTAKRPSVMVSKFNGRRNSSDLSSKDGHYDDLNVEGATKDLEVVHYGNAIPLRFSGLGKRLESLSEYADDEDSQKIDSNDSVT